MARILTLNRCIDPPPSQKPPTGSEAPPCPGCCVQAERGQSLPHLSGISAIESHKEALCQHVFHRLQREQPATMRSVCLRFVQYHVQRSRCVLMKWGHCKEGYHNHVVLALVVSSNGVPFYWEVLRWYG